MALQNASARHGALEFRISRSITLRQIGGVLLLSLLLSLLVGASFRAEPCCGVIGVDMAKGLATIRDNKTGRTWQFEAGDAVLSGLRIGSAVEADQADGKTLSIGGVRKVFVLDQPYPAAPCCGISQIHLAEVDGGIVVRNKTTGVTHHVSIGNQAVLAGLKVGQDVAMDPFAKWALLQAAVDGKPATFSFPVIAAEKPAVPVAPCCAIIAVDAANGLATIRNKTTGLTLQFEAGAQAIRAMKEGDDVVTASRPGVSGTQLISVGGIARSYGLAPASPLAPCCAVSVINGGVTTVDRTTGATHHIAVDNATARAAIKVGQDVSMDASEKWASFRLAIDGAPATYSFPVEATGRKPGPAADTLVLWEIRPNPDLKRALGRLVFGFNDADAIGGATILPAGQTDDGKTVFISDASALPPGKYDVLVNGAPVHNVPIESGMETVIKVGVLSVTAGIKAAIYDKMKKMELKFVDGGKTVLPIGTYYLKVNGAFAHVVIREKQVSEF